MLERSRPILFALEGFFPHQRAGTEVYVLNLSQYLISKGISVRVLISSTQELSDYVHEGIPVDTFSIPEKPILEELNGLIPPRGIERFLERVKQINPSIIHFHSIGRAINSYHIQEVKRLGFKTAYTPHLGGNICLKADFLKFESHVCSGKVISKTCTACLLHKRGLGKGLSILSSEIIHSVIRINKKLLPPPYLQTSHRKQEIDRIKNNTDAIIAIASWMREVFIANDIHQNLHLVNQGVDKLFLDKRANERMPQQDSIIRLGFIGRMQPIKGFHLLKDALQSFDGSKWNLVVATIASKDEEQYYQDMFTWASKHQQIEWRVNQSRDAVIKLLDTLDILVLPSISEMAPLVIQEAYARKVPVLGSSNYGIADMISDGVTGRVFKNGSVEDLKDKLTEILRNPELLKTWSSNISQPRTFDDVGEDMLNIYQSII